MKQYVLIAASIMLLAACQQRDEAEYSGTTSTGRETAVTPTTTNQVNRTDPTAVGTPGRTSETATQQSTQLGRDQIGSASDQTLTASIQSSLQAGIGNISADRLKNIEVNAANGRVTLKGNVASESEKQEIENHVKQLPGVQAVDNQIQVSSDSAQPQPQGQTPPPDQKNP